MTVALMIAFLQPYKQHFYNVVDAVMFALTGVIYIIITYQTAYIFGNGHSSTFLIVLTDLLTVAPLAYLFLLIICCLVKKKTFYTRKIPSSNCCFLNYSSTPVEDTQSAVPDRLLNPARYDDL